MQADDRARDLDGQGRHRGAGPRLGDVTQILVPEGKTVEVGTKLRSSAARPAARRPRPAAPPPAPAAQEAAAEGAASSSAESPAPAPEQAPAGAAPDPRLSQRRAGRQRPAGKRKSFIRQWSADHLRARHRPHPVPRTGRRRRVTKKDILKSWSPAPPLRLPLPKRPPPLRAPRLRGKPPPSRSRLPRRRHDRARSSRRARRASSRRRARADERHRRGNADRVRRSLGAAAHVASAIEVDLSPSSPSATSSSRRPRRATASTRPISSSSRAQSSSAQELPLDRRRDPRRADHDPEAHQPRLPSSSPRGRAWSSR